MNATIRIGDREIGPGAVPLLIAEVGQAHDGSLGMAHAYIDAIAEAGADAVKFQTHIADAESTRDEAFRVKFSRQDASRFDYWRRMEFTAEQWAGLAAHAAERSLIFLSSAFSLPAVALLDDLGMPAWKVGSGEYRSSAMLEAMAATGKPILLSTGMSRRQEIADAVAAIRRLGAPVALFQCTSKYPTAFDDVGLNVIDELRAAHECPVGLSDHSGSVFPALAALARGAELIEVHVVFDKRMFGPDAPASLTFDALRMLAEGRDAIASMTAHPVDKDAMADELERMRDLFTRSLAPLAPLAAGTVLSAAMLTTKKPGTGIRADALDRVVGRRLARDVAADRLLSWQDLA